MKRVLGLIVLAAACGGRTNLGDDDIVTDADLLDGSITTNDGGVVVKDASIGSDGGVIFVDASLPPSDGGVIVVDSGGGAIVCGNTTCDSNTDFCCVTFNGGQQVQEDCVSNGSTCQGASLTCTSAASCNGEVCCASVNGQSITAACAPQCQGGFQNPQLCAIDSECPKNQTCKNGPLGLKTCRP